MQLLCFFFLQVIVSFLVMVLVPDLVPVPVLVPVRDQNWSWSLVSVPGPSYFWSQPWSRSHHVLGPILSPGPGPDHNFWYHHTLQRSSSNQTE